MVSLADGQHVCFIVRWRTNNDNSRSSCPTGTTSLFSKADNCWIGVQQYCCSVPTELTACHWVSKTGGGISGDCSNAKCNATELEVDRSTWGDGSVTGCDCKLKCFSQRHVDVLMAVTLVVLTFK